MQFAAYAVNNFSALPHLKKHMAYIQKHKPYILK